MCINKYHQIQLLELNLALIVFVTVNQLGVLASLPSVVTESPALSGQARGLADLG